MLRRQPGVYMSKLKEPQFFASEMHIGSRPSQLPKTLDEYLALFDSARPGQVAGEASPSYLRSHTAAGRIAEVRPDARIVAILREPASFLRSVHLQFVQAGMEDQHDLRRALELEADRREGKNLPRHGFWPLSLQYSDQVRYVEQLRRYHAVFAPEQVLVLIYDDFRADNDGTMRTVMRFLGVEATRRSRGSNPTPPSARARPLPTDCSARSCSDEALSRDARARRSRRSYEHASVKGCSQRCGATSSMALRRPRTRS